ncbi:MAG: CD3324 family protein [Defluviitaleaceae bacterium]|nr:CD3324 family protein [Defluviitaleaceae bacterium]
MRYESRYKNARDVLPADVLALIQNYINGEYVYIPRKAEARRNWGDGTDSKSEVQERNGKIYERYKAGQKAGELAAEYYLSEKSIQRIITLGRKSELKQ